MSICNERKNRLFNEFDSESDRGCAVLTVCLLEETLVTVFASVLPGGGQAARNFIPRGRLSAGVENAEALGLISAPHTTNMRGILKIRNAFAHKLLDGLAFESPEIRAHVMQLTLPNLDGVSKETRDRFENVSRERYMHVFGQEIANLERLADVATTYTSYEPLPAYTVEV